MLLNVSEGFIYANSFIIFKLFNERSCVCLDVIKNNRTLIFLAYVFNIMHNISKRLQYSGDILTTCSFLRGFWLMWVPLYYIVLGCFNMAIFSTIKIFCTIKFRYFGIPKKLRKRNLKHALSFLLLLFTKCLCLTTKKKSFLGRNHLRLSKLGLAGPAVSALRHAIAEAKQRWSVFGRMTKTLLSQVSPCFGRQVKPLFPAAFAVVSTHQSALGQLGGLYPVLLMCHP
jgi:hypothetical protein